MATSSEVVTARARLAAVARHHPGADTELHFRNAFELLVATVLSAQSTDKRVNEVTPALFARFPTPAALADASQADVEQMIHATGFFRQKARAVIGLSRALVDEHGGQVPAEMDALVQLPGVGRKTANVVLGHALGVPGFPVDRHVLRVGARLGLIQTDDAVKAEAVLTTLVPPAEWTRTSDTLILHGRRICTPAPKCDLCHARTLCPYAIAGPRRVAKKAPARASASARTSKTAAKTTNLATPATAATAATAAKDAKGANPRKPIKAAPPATPAARPARARR